MVPWFVTFFLSFILGIEVSFFEFSSVQANTLGNVTYWTLTFHFNLGMVFLIRLCVRILRKENLFYVFQKKSFTTVFKKWYSQQNIVIYIFQYGILCGIGVSILMLLYPWARPEIEVTDLQELFHFAKSTNLANNYLRRAI